MRRRLLGGDRGVSDGIIDNLPFELDSNTSFLIKNETTLEERVFAYAEVIDGTYDTWLNGAFGGVLEWRTNGLVLSSGSTEYIRLVSNGGYPYLNDWSELSNLGQLQEINMGQDWIITVILDKELNGNNQRINVGVRGSGSNLFALMLRDNGNAYVVIDRLTTLGGYPDFQFLYPATDSFKLFTFSRIGGVFEAQINNSAIGLGSATFFMTTQDLVENSIVIGSRTYPSSIGGKITNYKHLRTITGSLSTLNKSAYNQSIMTKYGI